MAQQTVLFPESTIRNRSQVVSISNLKTVSATVNTGTVATVRDGSNVTVTVDNGTPSRQVVEIPQKTETSYLEGSSSSSANYPTTKAYPADAEGYVGVLNRSGSPVLYSGAAPISATRTASESCTVTQSWSAYQTGGSYTSSDTKTQTSTAACTIYWYWKWDGDYWSTDGWLDMGAADQITYNDGSYSGTLTKQSISGTRPSGPDYPGTSPGQSYWTTTSGTANYSGTVTRPASDTRTYGWETSGSRGNNAPNTYTYNDGTYSGTLNLVSVTGVPPSPGVSASSGATTSTSTSGTANYSGTVWTADTRVYRQSYSGTVTAPEQTTSYYAYAVTLTYTVYTPPTPPGAWVFPTAGAIVTSGQTTVKWTAGTDADMPQVFLKYHIQFAPDGVSWQDLIPLSPAGVTSFKYDFTVYHPDTTQAKLRIRTYDESMYSEWLEGPAFRIAHKIQTGEFYMLKQVGVLTLPLYDPTIGMEGKNQLRVYSGEEAGIGCLELVATDDPMASPLRVMTGSGVRSVSY